MVLSASCMRDDVVCLGTVGLEAYVVVELDRAVWAVRDPLGLGEVECSLTGLLVLGCPSARGSHLWVAGEADGLALVCSAVVVIE